MSQLKRYVYLSDKGWITMDQKNITHNDAYDITYNRYILNTFEGVYELFEFCNLYIDYYSSITIPLYDNTMEFICNLTVNKDNVNTNLISIKNIIKEKYHFQLLDRLIKIIEKDYLPILDSLIKIIPLENNFSKFIINPILNLEDYLNYLGSKSHIIEDIIRTRRNHLIGSIIDEITGNRIEGITSRYPGISDISVFDCLKYSGPLF